MAMRTPRSALLAVGLLAASLAASPSATALADDGDKPTPAPRTAIVIGGASVVLVSTADKLYGFVDRIDDNAPVEDSEISIDLADGSSVPMTRVGSGLFVGPFKRAGHMQDAFMVSLKSSAGSGDGAAEIGYDDVPAAAAAAAPSDVRGKISIALVAGAIGAIGAALWMRGRRRMAQAHHVAPAA